MNGLTGASQRQPEGLDPLASIRFLRTTTPLPVKRSQGPTWFTNAHQAAEYPGAASSASTPNSRTTPPDDRHRALRRDSPYRPRPAHCRAWAFVSRALGIAVTGAALRRGDRQTRARTILQATRGASRRVAVRPADAGLTEGQTQAVERTGPRHHREAGGGCGARLVLSLRAGRHRAVRRGRRGRRIEVAVQAGWQSGLRTSHGRRHTC